MGCCRSSCEGTGMTNVFAMGHVGACWILFMWSAAVQLVVLCGVQRTQAGVIPVHIYGTGSSSNGSKEEAGREGLSLYTPPPLVLDYHDGPLMTSSTGIPVYLLWYGVFSKSEKQTVADFVRSISPMNEQQLGLTPSVSMWWKTLTSYKDNRGMQVTSVVSIAGQHTDRSGSLGRNLNLLDVETLVENSVANAYFPADAAAVYVVVTAYNVNVQGFCLSSCGLHSFLQPNAKTKGKQLVYAWVGNPGTQCPGYCAWPFAVDPSIGPQDFKPLIAPNGVGADGMVINLATLLAGTATNPFNTGYYQGVATLPNEAATACLGSFGTGSYPGQPGQLLTNTLTKASFNAYGIRHRQFLLPALWDPTTQTCKTLT